MIKVRAVWARIPANEEFELGLTEDLFHWSLVTNLSKIPGSLGGARNAILKSCAEEGEDGVTMIAGKGDFSVASGKERSKGAGIRV